MLSNAELVAKAPCSQANRQACGLLDGLQGSFAAKLALLKHFQCSAIDVPVLTFKIVSIGDQHHMLQYMCRLQPPST